MIWYLIGSSSDHDGGIYEIVLSFNLEAEVRGDRQLEMESTQCFRNGVRGLLSRPERLEVRLCHRQLHIHGISDQQQRLEPLLGHWLVVPSKQFPERWWKWPLDCNSNRWD